MPKPRTAVDSDHGRLTSLIGKAAYVADILSEMKVRNVRMPGLRECRESAPFDRSIFDRRANDHFQYRSGSSDSLNADGGARRQTCGQFSRRVAAIKDINGLGYMCSIPGSSIYIDATRWSSKEFMRQLLPSRGEINRIPRYD